MSVAVVTGSAGLVGANAARLFAERGLEIAGIDNDMRSYFFGAEASTAWSRAMLERELPSYTHYPEDIRDADAMARIFARYGRAISLVVHAAAQPSHDWAAREPVTDFTVNANGTLNLLESVRAHCPDAVFVLVSTNKVYGDAPNRLPFEELATRWEPAPGQRYREFGIDESMAIDQVLHSLLGVSKLSADLLVQEFGRYFGIRTGIFRGGCLTGPDHAGAELHGFLAYLVKCAVTRRPYTVMGYRGKQVRDNIHARDLVEAFWCFYRNPRIAEVYNIGGSRHSNCSLLEAVAMAQELTGEPMTCSYRDSNRVGDHIWWISDVRKFQGHYPEWTYRHDMASIMREIHEACVERYGR
jgi:CDP-paratose 2-epimerase